MVDARKVAVIGAGVAGLVAARELQSEGHRVVVFEKSDKVGGLWFYDLRVESDKLDHDPIRLVVHSSIYQSLRTNLPRALMSFSGFPFAEREYGDPRKFPGHEEVLRYLNDFATCYGISELTRFNSDVILVDRVEGRADRWVVEWQVKGEDGTLISQEEIFDAVVVCNGHCTVPRLAAIPGIEKWPGKQTHSHNYRIPEPFTDQVVVVIGNGASAYDISRDIAKVAKAVHVSSRSSDAKFLKLDHYHNMWHHSSISDAKEDGTVEFEDGSSVHASVIMHCSGYKHNFPFLNTNGIVSIDDPCGTAVQTCISARAHSLALFCRLTSEDCAEETVCSNSAFSLHDQTLIFDTMELQSKWIARALSGKVHLPAIEDMMADTREFYQQMTLLNRPKHLTHYLENSEEYLEYLAAQAGVPPLEDWRNAVFREILARQVNREDGFRDE